MSEFQWPEPTDEALMKIWEANYSGFPNILRSMRDAIALDRQLLADHADKDEIIEAWQNTSHNFAWLLTRGGTVRPKPPTLAEAREAARLLAGPAAEIVTRYLESQEGQADG